MKNIALLVLLLIAKPAFAAMSLDKIIVYLDDTPNAREDIVITNPDKEPLYLQTEIFRVDNPGTASEQRVRVIDPKDFRLLVNPARAIIAPGEQKRFRLMSLETGLDNEKVYRVTFRPVVGEIKSDRSALKILVAYQALVFIQPAGGKYELELAATENSWSLRNSGNVNVEVIGMRYCPASGDCDELDVKGRIYAGSALDVAIPGKGGMLEVRARARDGVQDLKFAVSGAR